MKHIFLTALFALLTTSLCAQDKFNPKDFETELENYVVKEAKLTSDESAAFLPIYREMRKKQVALIEADRKVRSKKASTDAEWAEQITKHDNAEILQKKNLQTYHNKMLKAVPAEKVFKALKAEENYFRKSLKKMHQDGAPQGSPQQGGTPPPPPPGKN